MWMANQDTFNKGLYCICALCYISLSCRIVQEENGILPEAVLDATDTLNV